MCGIAGIIDYQKSTDPGVFEKFRDALAHRGPDDAGTIVFEQNTARVALMHRRLSILDLSNAAAQPMQYKRWTLIFNGEIFNFRELQQQLIEMGHHFKSTSDTEVILHAWEEWGSKMVHRLNGMFAFAIFDKEENILHCFRDRTGIKPFFYYLHNNLFLFASELKSFHSHPSFSKTINTDAVAQFIQYGYIMQPRTIFQHAHKLPQGHYLKFDVTRQKITLEQYWSVIDFYNRPKLNIDYSEALIETRALLTKACEYRMIADVPVGIFLSGGYDSTAVTALLQRNRSAKLKTFTIGFEDAGYDESGHAARVAQFLGTDHYSHICTAEDAKTLLPIIPDYCDEPFGDSSIIPTMMVSRLAREQVKVALSADAGDEIFGGYIKYDYAIKMLQFIQRLPLAVRDGAATLLRNIPNNLLTILTRNPAIAFKKSRIAQMVSNKDVDILKVMDSVLSQSFSASECSKLMRNPLQGSISAPLNLLTGIENNYEKMMALDYITYLPDDILVKVDRAGMHVSLEGREPLIDFNLIEFLAQLPAEFKISPTQKKRILKDIVHEMVPANIIDRPKKGFGVPIDQWLRGPLKDIIRDYMQPAAFRKHDLFNGEAVMYIQNRFYAGDKNYNTPFWFLLMFQMWFKRWMD